MKKIIFAFFLLTSCTLFAGSNPSDTTKTAKSPVVSDCQCIYPLTKNVDNINWCIGSKGGKYCINRKGTKTYRSSVVNR